MVNDLVVSGGVEWREGVSEMEGRNRGERIFYVGAN
jgi:hypothetical protein